MKIKRFCKILISLFLISTLLTLMVVNVDAINADDKTFKIENYLVEQLENMDNNETIDVSVWLTDIQESEINEKLFEAVNQKVSAGQLPREIFSLLPNLSMNGIENTDYNNLTNIENNITVDQAQLLISTKRQVSSELYRKNNTEKLKKLFTDKKLEKCLKFQSHYSPNVVLNLSKDEVYEISKNDSVSQVFIFDTGVQFGEDTNVVNNPDSVASSSPSFSTYQYEMTGISYLRDVLNLTGDGIKVGIYDTEFTLPSLVDYIADDTIQAYPSSNYLHNDYCTHGGNVAYLIAGNYTDSVTNETYLGAAPDAELYLEASNNDDPPTIYRTCLENLLDYGVNIINASRWMGSTTVNDGYNNYGDAAKWIDHITSQHNVLFVSSAGNVGPTGITSGKFGYNAVVVGGCDSNGQLYENSSYSSLNNNVFKPDLVAPGTDIYTPVIRCCPQSYHHGTSWSSAIVTGAAAQLCQSSSLFLTYPHLLKSALLSGTTLNSYITSDADMIITDTSSTDNKFSRKFGAGILNCKNSYESCVVNNYKSYGYVPNFVNYVSSAKQISVSEGDLIRVCASWDKKVTLANDHTISTPSTPGLENYLLEVCTPSNVKYRALYDNKEMVSFYAQESGTYTINLVRISQALSTVTGFGISISVQSYT